MSNKFLLNAFSSQKNSPTCENIVRREVRCESRSRSTTKNVHNKF